MRERFDAANDAPQQDDLAAGAVGHLEERLLERELYGLLDELDELVATIEDEQDDEPLGPEQVTALEAVSGGDDAPLAFRSINRRVHEGLLSWEQFWEHPDDEGQAGVDLLFAALGHISAALPDQIAAAREAAGLQDGPDWGRAPGR